MRRGKETDQADALVYTDEPSQWLVFCVLCPRELPRVHRTRGEALWAAHEHLRFTHGLRRVRVDQETPAHRQAVQDALPLVLAHDRTLPTDRWTS